MTSETPRADDVTWRRKKQTMHVNYALFCAYVTLSILSINGDDWCSLDSGFTTITDGHGHPHSVYVSATRDGSIWLRAGRDHASLDWTYDDERRTRTQTVILDRRTVRLLESINYTDHCVLTDLDLTTTVDYGWHPSHLAVFDPTTKHSKIILFKRSLDCHRTTQLTLSRDKQGIVCEGGRRNACRRRTLAEAGGGHSTLPVFLKVVNFDPKGQDHWQCDEDKELNSYTLKGSYYHVYVKLASCDTPKDSRTWGHEAKLRPHSDRRTNTILIPDPIQGAIGDGAIMGWHVFAKLVSPNHVLYLQVWRPRSLDERVYTLVGETRFLPTELRFQEVTLKDRGDDIRFRRGDVLGVYFPRNNPIAWSSVPCAFDQQRHLFAAPVNVSGGGGEGGGDRGLDLGVSVRFAQSTVDKNACRHYSFTAIVGEKFGAKSLEDWICPSGTLYSSTRRLSGLHDDRPSLFHLHDNAKVVAGRKNTAFVAPSNDRRGPFGYHGNDRTAANDVIAPSYLALSIVVGLLTLLMATGLVSYLRAMRIDKLQRS